jgi:hypothetical protein
MQPDENKSLLRELMTRYLCSTDHSLGEQLLKPERDEVHLHITPTRAYTWDFGDRMADSVDAD